MDMNEAMIIEAAEMEFAGSLRMDRSVFDSRLRASKVLVKNGMSMEDAWTLVEGKVSEWLFTYWSWN